ncbi:MAG: hypothetical protein K6F59_01230 [Gammaproteobacteria bacterium]|nr:hypothetical protein [Gammaproteobacteria bacterium]
MATRFDDSNVRSGLKELKKKVEAGLTIYGETVAKDFESYAKKNRPWTDRTGAARQRLNGYTQKVTQGVRICIAHGVSYGINLELAHGKKYAILEPTVRLKSNDVIKGIKAMWKSIKVK